jgi:hypothetical protein
MGIYPFVKGGVIAMQLLAFNWYYISIDELIPLIDILSLVVMLFEVAISTEDPEQLIIQCNRWIIYILLIQRNSMMYFKLPNLTAFLTFIINFIQHILPHILPDFGSIE